ncbi:MAG TPA: GntR family transcriptional regulator [Planctomycetota bacterium]|nr:GntR family transcriptional regulator [Planctomycetota bacterium]
MAATLVDRIHADLLHRFAGGERPDLRLVALAGHYQTSTRPVRLALDRLREDGVLAQTESRRWNLARAPRRAPAPPAPDDARARLHDLLVRRSLAGDAGFLREDQCAAELGIGRGQLRGLLAAFAGAGLVVHEPRRGWRARVISQADLDAFLSVREALELLAVDLACDRLDPERLAEFEKANADDGGEADNRLHAYIIDCAGNAYIADFFARHGPFFDLLFAWEDNDEAASAQARRHHRAILRALRAGDRERAKRALSEHIRGNHPVLEELLARR